MAYEWWYEVDADNRVSEVGPGWDEFALANDSPGATRDRVIGRDLFGFLDGAETRALVRLILDRTREAGRCLELPFRCDGPGVRRFMVFTGEVRAGGGVRVHTRQLGEGEREALPFLERTGRGREPIRMCSWCNRIAAADQWLEAESAADRLGLFLRELPRITHGICPGCETGVMSSLSEGAAA